MDAPPIQFAHTDDGVNIAYWAIGHGPIIVLSHYHALSHLDGEWEMPALRQWYEELARDFTVVRYNRRGTGQSERENIPRPMSIDHLLLDIEAVVEALGGGRISLMASFMGTGVALEYVAKHAEQVDRLILFEPHAVGEEYSQASVVAAVQATSANVGVNLVALVAAINMAPDGTEKMEALLDLLNRSYSIDTIGDNLGIMGIFAIPDVLSQVTVETLVIQPELLRDTVQFGGQLASERFAWHLSTGRARCPCSRPGAPGTPTHATLALRRLIPDRRGLS